VLYFLAPKRGWEISKRARDGKSWRLAADWAD
jgi:hypothetical protein